MADKTKIITKVQTFDDVQKSLQDIETRLNELGGSTNEKGEGSVTDREGKTGDTRITQGADKEYTFEVMTEEGWKFGSVGESPVTFTDKPAEFSKPDAVVNKFKDDLGSPTNMPRPDYDSGFFHVQLSKFYITGATTGEIPDGIGAPALVASSLIGTDADVPAAIVGIPDLGFEMNSPPTLVQSIVCPPGITTWKEALDTGIIRISNGHEGQHYSSWAQEGGVHYILGPKRFTVIINNDRLFIQPGISGVSSDFSSTSSQWYDAFLGSGNGTSETGSYRLRIWK